MSSIADEIIDRRQLRRKLSFWRIAAFIILALALLAMIIFAARDQIFSKTSENHIAKIKITGVITNDEPLLKLLRKIGENDKVDAVILNISSPGGSTVGGEAIYETVRELAEKKPVVTTVDTLAASAGYMIASATDHIVARRSSIIGSIGVLFQYADASELLDKIGVKVKAVKSAPLKAEPSPFNPASDEAIAMIDRLIQDSYKWFVEIVAERRDMTKFEVRKLADGSVFTGSQSLENGLVDAIGSEDTAVKWLEESKDIKDELDVIEYTPKRPSDGLFSTNSSIQKIAQFFGLNLTPGSANTIDKLIQERLLLDGLVSIWHGYYDKPIN